MDERERREEETRKYVREPWLDSFDREFYAEFGRYPTASRLGGRPGNSARRQKVAALAAYGATPGERAAASAALERIDAESIGHAARMDRLDSETYE